MIALGSGEASSPPGASPDVEDPHGELLLHLAHDLRSPLGVIAEALHQLRAELGAEISPQHGTLAALADRSLRRLARIADRVALLATLERGRLEVARYAVSLDAVARRAVEGVGAMEARKGVLLEREPIAPQVRVVADEARLVQATEELLSNALRHAATRVRIAAEASNGDVRLVVEDDGDGIPPARVEDAFRRYPLRGSRAGLHVGLSMARALVEAQGGSLSIEPSTLEPTRADGPGVRFVVTLPGAK